MIFDENTSYLLCTVKFGDKELYKNFDVTEAWNAMLTATSDQRTVVITVKPMSADQARRAQRELTRAEGRMQQARRDSDDRTTNADSSSAVTTIPGR